MSAHPPRRFGPARLRELFDEALGLEPERRGDFLDRQCGGEDGLRPEIESLLAAHLASRDFLEATSPPADREPAGAQPPSVPTDIPGYEVVREIHRGGQGLVFEAVQRSTRRKVAIKVLLEAAWASAA